MGLFDFLFGKKEELDPDPLPDGPRVPTWQEWEETDSADRVQWLGGELEQVKAACDKAGIRVSPELYRAELRGIYKGRPVAVVINAECEAELTVKFINRRGHINLGPPLPGISDREPADDEFWSDDSDSVAPLIGPKVALHANAKTIEQAQAVWKGLPGAARERVLAWMSDRPGHHIVVARHQAFESHELIGPRYAIPLVPRITRSFDELVALAELFGQGEAQILPIGAGPAWTPEQQTCSYCETTFYVDREDTRCPACGAN